jgi:RNA polymerase sigma-70 factor (ECF subfamily)
MTTIEPVPEKDLVERAALGDHAAFETLLEQHDQRVMNLILRFTADQFDRDELYQDIFTACYVALPRFSGKSSFYTWLYRIALNRCISFARRHQPVLEVEEIPVPDADWAQRQQLKAISRALQKLKGPQQIAFHLFYIEQWSKEEISGVLEITVGTVKSHLHRAREKIRLDKEVAQWPIKI